MCWRLLASPTCPGEVISESLKMEETLCVMLGKGQGKWPQCPGRKKEGIPRGRDQRRVRIKILLEQT